MDVVLLNDPEPIIDFNVDHNFFSKNSLDKKHCFDCKPIRIIREAVRKRTTCLHHIKYAFNKLGSCE